MFTECLIVTTVLLLEQGIYRNQTGPPRRGLTAIISLVAQKTQAIYLCHQVMSLHQFLSRQLFSDLRIKCCWEITPTCLIFVLGLQAS